MAGTPVRAVNNAFYNDLGRLWFEGDGHAVSLLRAEGKQKLKYLREVFSKERLPPMARILDIGCGGGLLAAPLAQDGFNVKGVDPASGAIEAARSQAPSGAALSFAVGDAYSLREASESFDAVLLMDVLEHLERPDQALEEAARVLKPGGILVFHTFNKTWIAWLLAIQGARFVVRDSPEDLHIYRLLIPPEEIRRIGEACGLELKDIRGVWPRLLSWPFAWSLLHRRVHPEFSFMFTRILNVGYLGYFQKNTKTGQA